MLLYNRLTRLISATNKEINEAKTSLAFAAASFYSHAGASNTFQLENVFDLEYANQIEMTKNGDTIYFVRNRMDIKSDRKVSNIWSVNPDGKTMLPLTSGVHMDYSPVLSPDETRLAFISTRDGSQIYKMVKNR